GAAASGHVLRQRVCHLSVVDNAGCWREDGAQPARRRFELTDPIPVHHLQAAQSVRLAALLEGVQPAELALAHGDDQLPRLRMSNAVLVAVDTQERGPADAEP